MRALHFGIASLFLLVLLYRLYWWVVGPKPVPPAGMPPSAFSFARLVQLTLLVTLALMGISGFTYAWANGFVWADAVSGWNSLWGGDRKLHDDGPRWR